ncbi:hypothetical protein [Dyella subtropica]|uniref:hypothetical protein n=1 Tax=Dyella subtropica TaxID=2992127 RepID=UPI00224DEF3D|nr:hypothetical protein [Dyella subtropica]
MADNDDQYIQDLIMQFRANRPTESQLIAESSHQEIVTWPYYRDNLLRPAIDRTFYEFNFRRLVEMEYTGDGVETICLVCHRAGDHRVANGGYLLFYPEPLPHLSEYASSEIRAGQFQRADGFHNMRMTREATFRDVEARIWEFIYRFRRFAGT